MNHQVLLAVAEVVAPVLVLVPISTIMFVVRDSMNIIMCLDGHLFLNVQIVQQDKLLMSSRKEYLELSAPVTIVMNCAMCVTWENILTFMQKP